VINRYKIHIKETIANIICDEKFYNLAIEEIFKVRETIENFIKKHPEFAKSYTPIAENPEYPEIINQMCKASSLANVGPMAGIAGAIAYFVAKKVVSAGANFFIFDNGGDIALKINKPITVGIFTGEHKTNKFGIKIKPKKDIFGICTSSGRIGHSFSYGSTNATTIIAQNPIIADAFATFIGNQIKKEDKKDIENILEKFNISELETIIVIIGQYIGFIGQPVEFVKTNVDFNLIAK